MEDSVLRAWRNASVSSKAASGFRHSRVVDPNCWQQFRSEDNEQKINFTEPQDTQTPRRTLQELLFASLLCGSLREFLFRSPPGFLFLFLNCLRCVVLSLLDPLRK